MLGVKGCACCASSRPVWAPGKLALLTQASSPCMRARAGVPLGRVLLFDAWAFSDGRLGRPFVRPVLPGEAPTPASLAALQEVGRHREGVRAGVEIPITIV
jgi:hypothetical protein